MNLLFVVGAPRSGTTALTDYLNQHQEIMICRERYKYTPKTITPDSFIFERILDYMSLVFHKERREKELLSEEQRAFVAENKDSEIEECILDCINKQWNELGRYVGNKKV